MSDRKRARFVRLAEKRVAKAIKALRLIGLLSDRGQFSYEDRDADKILAALEVEITDVKNRFNDEATRKEVKFTLG